MYSNSASVSCSAPAIELSVDSDGCTSSPASSRAYHLTPMSARNATSSRRSPGVRRPRRDGMPTCSGAIASRRLRKKRPSASLGVSVEPFGALESKSPRNTSSIAAERPQSYYQGILTVKDAGCKEPIRT